MFFLGKDTPVFLWFFQVCEYFVTHYNLHNDRNITSSFSNVYVYFTINSRGQNLDRDVNDRNSSVSFCDSRGWMANSRDLCVKLPIIIVSNENKRLRGFGWCVLWRDERLLLCMTGSLDCIWGVILPERSQWIVKKHILEIPSNHEVKARAFVAFVIRSSYTHIPPEKLGFNGW